MPLDPQAEALLKSMQESGAPPFNGYAGILLVGLTGVAGEMPPSILM